MNIQRHLPNTKNFVVVVFDPIDIAVADQSSN